MIFYHYHHRIFETHTSLNYKPRRIKALTFTCRSGFRVIPGAVGLATNDPLTLVEVPRVTGEHHHGLILILHAIDKPPSPMLYC